MRIKAQDNCAINLARGLVLYASSASPRINPRLEEAIMPIRLLSKKVFVSRGKVPIIEIDIRNSIKNEIPPMAGFTVVAHLIWFTSDDVLTPRLNEKRRNNQFMRKEKKLLIKKYRSRNKNII